MTEELPDPSGLASEMVAFGNVGGAVGCLGVEIGRLGEIAGSLMEVGRRRATAGKIGVET